MWLRYVSGQVGPRGGPSWQRQAATGSPSESLGLGHGHIVEPGILHGASSLTGCDNEVCPYHQFLVPYLFFIVYALLLRVA